MILLLNIYLYYIIIFQHILTIIQFLFQMYIKIFVLNLIMKMLFQMILIFSLILYFF